MEIILPLVVIVFLFIINSRLNRNFRNLDNRIKSLDDSIYHLEKKIDSYQKDTVHKETHQTKESEPIFEEPKVETPITKEPILEEQQPVTEEFDELPSVVEEEPAPFFESSSHVNYVEPVKEAFAEYEQEPVQRVVRKSLFERFKEKNPDLERFIGENLINKIGILILVLGVSFFVKYAIDKDWINEPARVGIGILAGGLVMFIAHRLRKNYKAFSSVLVAGAISIFYFTIYIAFHEYELFSQTVAFGIMTFITAFSVFVSVSYDRQELAVLSTIGGFIAPFLVSTGEGNYIVLFSYIAILNAGILTISYFRKWKVVTILAFLFTSIIYVGWLGIEVLDGELPHANALIFATLFYFIFSIAIVLNNLRNKGVFTGIEYFILIANTFFFFGMGTVILRDWESSYDGLFTLSLAVYNIIYASILFKKFGLEKNAVYVLIGLAMTFVTLTVPIQFEGNQITLFWAAEAVLLLWLAQRSGINSFRQGSVIVLLLSLISLVIDWERYLETESFDIIANPLFLAGIVVSAALYFIFWLTKKEEDFKFLFYSVPIAGYRVIVVIIAVIITYFTGMLEISYQAYERVSGDISAFSFPVIYHMIFLSVLVFITQKIKQNNLTKVILALGLITIIGYLIDFHSLPSKELLHNYMFGKDNHFALYFHYVVLVSLLYFVYTFYQNAKVVIDTKKVTYKITVWFLVFVLVFAASTEVMVHSLYIFDVVDIAELKARYPDGEDLFRRNRMMMNQFHDGKMQIVKIGYPILWGALSFVFLIVGIKQKLKNLRIISLSLLGITIVKLFAYDIQNVSETGKIIAFILLGVLILIISFVYQRIKKLVIDEDNQNTENEKENT